MPPAAGERLGFLGEEARAEAEGFGLLAGLTGAQEPGEGGEIDLGRGAEAGLERLGEHGEIMVIAQGLAQPVGRLDPGASISGQIGASRRA